MQSSSSRRTSTSAVVAMLAAVGFALLVAAAADADPITCRREINKRSAKLAQVKITALQKCEDAVLNGRSGGPCPDARAAAKVEGAESKLRAAIVQRCGGADRACGTGDDEPLAAIGWDVGACPGLAGAACGDGIASCLDVGTCVACVDHAGIERAVDLVYGALASSGNVPVRTCQRTIGSEARKFLVTKSKALRTCADGVLNGASGPCPDAKAGAKIASATSKLTDKICRACGGSDDTCGTGDDLSVAAIGFPASCPAVTIPAGSACGGPVGSLADLVACVGCVSEFEADCLAALAAPGPGAYPRECAAATPAATPHPTTTPTPSSCGDSLLDPGEECDGAADTACAGECRPDCTCPPPCILPNPLPEVIAIKARPGGVSDSGWTGISHDTPNVDDALLSAARLHDCDVDLDSPTCGQCSLAGPVAFPGPAKNCVCYNVAAPDTSAYTTCDPEAASPCDAPNTCACFNGPPLPLVAGGIPVCTVNRYATPITGTANIAVSGPHTGEIELRFRLAAAAHNGLDIEQPCPTCENDPTPLDGNRGGTCLGGSRNGLACDAAGSNSFFGTLSLDCPPAASSNVGNLRIVLEPETTGVSTLGTGPTCSAAGYGSMSCFCDTCTTAAAEPCHSNADCPSGATCGGRRCLSGANVGTPCSVASQCPGGACGRAGQTTAPNACLDKMCSPDASAPGEGICASGPFDGVCNVETFRTCTGDADCNPPPNGSCDACASNQRCEFRARDCYLDPIVRQGVPGADSALLTAAYCIPPTSAAAINQVSGLPGAGAVSVPVSVFKTGSQCGNGVIDSGETCDPPADGACPGRCQAGCACRTCGDGLVDQASEECDGLDDGACPGACQPDCTCSTGVCGNDTRDFGEECDGTADLACPGACQPNCTCGTICGDDTVDAGEECDGTGSTACPAAACQPDCTCGPYCGDGRIDPGEACDGSGEGVCPGTCQSDCSCAPVCGDGIRQAGELCDGDDDALCPGQCAGNCTCPGRGEISLFVEANSDLDAGWTGTVHDAQLQRGSKIFGELSGCDGQTDFACDFFGNIGSFCSADPSRSCTNDNECTGAGSCVIQYLGPPLPVSAGGVPACVLARFSSDAVGSYDLHTGALSFSLGLNALAHLGLEVSQPCPICDCGKADTQDCQIGETGTCAGSGIIAGGPCTVQGTGPLGPTSLDCPPSSSLNVTGTGLDLPFQLITTGTVSMTASQPCTGAGFQNQSCWCAGETQPNSCALACNGGANDAQACETDADCPGAPAGACTPLCRQIAGEAVGEGECVAGPVEETCANAPEIGCTATSGCPSGTGPCIAKNKRCFMNPLVRQGVAGTSADVLAASICVPATGSSAIDQTAGLPGPAALTFPNTVTAALCGDGTKNRVQEECDGGDDDTCPGGCLPNCTCQRTCGNDVVEFGEQCDGLVDTACPGQCIAAGSEGECTCPPICGDGFVGPGEQCDPGGTGGNPPANDASCPGLCVAASCQCPLPPLPQCGNSTLDPGEACELPATGCGPLQACLLCNQCFPPPDLVPADVGFICGNGTLEPTETCEVPAIGCAPGAICNPTTCDECIPVPITPVCGNLNIEPGEACELPAAGCGQGQLCLLCQQCIPFVPFCGNLLIEDGEACELPARGCGPTQVCLACQQCVP